MTKTPWVKIKLNDTVINLTDQYPLHLITVNEGFSNYQMDGKSNAGVDGESAEVATFGPFALDFEFSLRAVDVADFHLLKTELKQLLYQRNPYEVMHSHMPGRKYVVKRAEITLDNRKKYVARLKIQFCVYKGYSESIGTTLKPFSTENDLWQMGNLVPLKEDCKYQHSTNRFRIYNGSCDTIHPLREHALRIVIKGNGKPTLMNTTTKDVFKCYLSITPKNTLVLEGIYPTLDGKRIGSETNNGVIALAPGWNEFLLEGITSPDISFDFPFIYR